MILSLEQAYVISYQQHNPYKICFCRLPTFAPLRSIEFLWLLSAAATASVGEADPEASPAPPARLGPSFANRSSMSNVPLMEDLI